MQSGTSFSFHLPDKSIHVLFQFSLQTQNEERLSVDTQMNERWNNTIAKNENMNLVSNIFSYLFRDFLCTVWGTSSLLLASLTIDKIFFGQQKLTYHPFVYLTCSFLD